MAPEHLERHRAVTVRLNGADFTRHEGRTVPHVRRDDFDLRDYRRTIETVNSQLDKMAIERLYARTNPGLSLKVHASIVALALTIDCEANKLWTNCAVLRVTCCVHDAVRNT